MRYAKKKPAFPPLNPKYTEERKRVVRIRALDLARQLFPSGVRDNAQIHVDAKSDEDGKNTVVTVVVREDISEEDKDWESVE